MLQESTHVFEWNATHRAFEVKLGVVVVGVKNAVVAIEGNLSYPVAIYSRLAYSSLQVENHRRVR